MGALRDQVTETHSIVAELDEEQLALSSACPGWSISDVLLHLAQTNEAAAASGRGQPAGSAGGWTAFERLAPPDFDDLAGRLVERERGASGVDVRKRWVKSAYEMVDALQACDPSTRVRWAVGDMAPRSLASARIAETWIHTGDVCGGLGTAQPKSDRIWHIARLVHRTLPYSFERAARVASGEVRFELTSPVDTSVVWQFGGDGAETVISGPAADLCLVAGQRATATATSLAGTGPAAKDVLALMRTFA
jgi:uncharacterized protein (TIGR03084 family)